SQPLNEFVGSSTIEALSNAIGQFGVIPPRHLMNELFSSGQAGKSYSWEPFQISEQEYEALSESLVTGSCEGFVTTDRSLWSSATLAEWFEALKSKIRANPTYKQFSWRVQHAVIGIPVSKTQWIPRNVDFKGRKSKNIDGILRPLKPFFRGLQHCVPECCRIEAFSFHPDDVLKQADSLGRCELVGLLDNALIDLEQLDDSIEVVISEVFNDKVMKQEMISLIEHFLAVLARGA
ncbi:MAG: DUF6331 family protein, partial [Woeseia sp.]